MTKLKLKLNKRTLNTLKLPTVPTDVAAALPGDTWSINAPVDDAVVHAAPALRERIAAGWLTDALTLHASLHGRSALVGALLTRGAPGALVIAGWQWLAAGTEQAQVAFTLASRYAGSPVQPGPFDPPLTATPSAGPLPEAVLRDWCLGETVNALRATRANRQAAWGSLSAFISRMAAQAIEHAAAGWEALEWCLSGADLPTWDRFQEAAAALGEALEEEPAPQRDPDATALWRHGRLAPAMEHAVRQEAWHSIGLPIVASLRG